jgi:hypothetical protein
MIGIQNWNVIPKTTPTNQSQGPPPARDLLARKGGSLDLRPVTFEFFGDHPTKAGERAAADFRAMARAIRQAAAGFLSGTLRNRCYGIALRLRSHAYVLVDQPHESGRRFGGAAFDTRPIPASFAGGQAHGRTVLLCHFQDGSEGLRISLPGKAPWAERPMGLLEGQRLATLPRARRNHRCSD